jgi:small conductance mechanosensitive channel
MESPWNLIQEKLEEWWLYSVKMLPNFLLAIVVLIAFILVAKLIRKVSYNFLLRISKSISVSSLLSGVIYTFVFISGIMSALDILELDKTVSSLLAGVGIIGLALGFAFQDITSNFIAGAFIALKRPFDIGHTVETNGFLGTIEDIQLRSTTLRTSAGLHVIIPNKDIFQKPIINYSRTDARKVELEFVFPNSVDALFVQEIILQALENIKEQKAMQKLEFYFIAIENPNLKVHVSFWTHRIEPDQFMKARHRAIAAIFHAFRENGIYEIKTPPPPINNLPDVQNG